MAKRLKDINVTHISLVAKAANERTFIYKSADKEPLYDNIVKIAKVDEEKGLVYGIVYEVEKEDAQGDLASAIEIEKAAHNFLKSLNNRNVDTQHNFKGEGACVVESWIVRKGDEIFPDATPGAWAVTIELEKEELKKAVKNGDYTGLSMAGTAIREDIAITDKSLTETIKSVFENVLKSFKSGEKSQKVDKEAIEKEIRSELEPILKERDELKNRAQKAEILAAELKKERDELKTELTKSKQNTEPANVDINDALSIAKAATELIKKEADKGNILSVADAVTQLTKKEEQK